MTTNGEAAARNAIYHINKTLLIVASKKIPSQALICLVCDTMFVESDGYEEYDDCPSCGIGVLENMAALSATTSNEMEREER